MNFSISHVSLWTWEIFYLLKALLKGESKWCVCYSFKFVVALFFWYAAFLIMYEATVFELALLANGELL